jgi:type I restriction enzyme S subunit
MIDGRWFAQVPDGWEVLRLKRTVVLSKARIDERPSELRYIGLENIESWTGRIIDSEASAVENDVFEGSGVVSLFKPGEVLFGKLRPYLAKTCLVTELCVGTTELLALKPYPRLDARFLLYVFLTSGFISLVDSSTFGTKMPRADWEFIGNVMIPLPTLSEQRAIINLLDS